MVIISLIIFVQFKEVIIAALILERVVALKVKICG
jgi:hypothetical protein